MKWCALLLPLALAACSADGGQALDEADAVVLPADAGRRADAASSNPPDAGALPIDAGEPMLQIGTGARRFEPLEEGQEVPIIKGNQGGYHVWGGFLASGFPLEGDIRVQFDLLLDEEVIASADYTEFELPVDSMGRYDYSGVSVVYLENARVELTSGMPMTLRLHLSVGDLQLEDAIGITPICCE
ncbi:MAG: hypothetical protein H6706_23670 [Myxococcales bacterium]|nr:hypothetical protein [Myxococcales bacterium]